MSCSDDTPVLPTPPHVLIVDNEPALTAVVADILESEGYRVTVANEARTALEIARRDAPTLVLSDIMMPGMDGLQLLKELRRNTNNVAAEIPVVFFTASAEERLARQLGACDIIRKPATREQLLQKVFDGVALGFVRPGRPSGQAVHAY